MEKAMKEFEEWVPVECVALVYYSGHGCGDRGNTPLLCGRGKNESLRPRPHNEEGEAKNHFAALLQGKVKYFLNPSLKN